MTTEKHLLWTTRLRPYSQTDSRQPVNAAVLRHVRRLWPSEAPSDTLHVHLCVHSVAAATAAQPRHTRNDGSPCGSRIYDSRESPPGMQLVSTSSTAPALGKASWTAALASGAQQLLATYNPSTLQTRNCTTPTQQTTLLARPGHWHFPLNFTTKPTLNNTAAEHCNFWTAAEHCWACRLLRGGRRRRRCLRLLLP